MVNEANWSLYDNDLRNKKMYEILSILKSQDRSENYLSGEILCKKVMISRAAVWKMIRKLRSYGYKIESKQALGYRLVAATRLPVPWELVPSLATKFIGKKILYYHTISSTQDIALDVAEEEDSNGLVIIAEKQESGRGRIGRKWVSESGGLWMSVILKPKIHVAKSTILPFVGAIAVCETINEKFKLNSRLKWPNDVIISGKKVAGILLEVSAEGPHVNYAIMGVGVNANFEPETVSLVASNTSGYFGITSLKNEVGKEINMLEFSKTLLENIEHYYKILEGHDGPHILIKRWKEVSATLGSRVSVQKDNDVIKGTAIDINEDGSLVVKKDGGGLEAIVSGDVFLK